MKFDLVARYNGKRSSCDCPISEAVKTVLKEGGEAYTTQVEVTVLDKTTNKVNIYNFRNPVVTQWIYDNDAYVDYEIMGSSWRKLMPEPLNFTVEIPDEFIKEDLRPLGSSSS